MTKCQICKKEINLFNAFFDKKGRPVHPEHAKEVKQ